MPPIIAPKAPLDLATIPPQRRKVYDFIVEYSDLNGYPPSIREIADHLGVSSTFGVRKHIDNLIEHGFSNRSGANLSRALRVTPIPPATS